MGQSTFSVASDLNFFSCDSNEGYNSATPSRPTSSLGKNIQDVVTSHIEASRIGKLIVEEMKNGKGLKFVSRVISKRTNQRSSFCFSFALY